MAVGAVEEEPILVVARVDAHRGKDRLGNAAGIGILDVGEADIDLVRIGCHKRPDGARRETAKLQGRRLAANQQQLSSRIDRDALPGGKHRHAARTSKPHGTAFLDDGSRLEREAAAAGCRGVDQRTAGLDDGRTGDAGIAFQRERARTNGQSAGVHRQRTGDSSRPRVLHHQPRDRVVVGGKVSGTDQYQSAARIGARCQLNIARDGQFPGFRGERRARLGYHSPSSDGGVERQIGRVGQAQRAQGVHRTTENCRGPRKREIAELLVGTQPTGRDHAGGGDRGVGGGLENATRIVEISDHQLAAGRELQEPVIG